MRNSKTNEIVIYPFGVVANSEIEQRQKQFDLTRKSQA